MRDIPDLGLSDSCVAVHVVLALATRSQTIMLFSLSQRRLILAHLTYVELFSKIAVLCRCLCSQSCVTQEVLAVYHFNFQLLLQWEVEELDAFFYEFFCHLLWDTAVFDVEKADIHECLPELFQKRASGLR